MLLTTRFERRALCHGRPSRWLHVESLETRQLLAAAPLISEFLAVNDTGRNDRDGETADWIEIFNAGDAPADLTGYALTDDPADLTQWRFPRTVLDPGQHLLVFASGKNRRDPASELHTNFALRGGGEFLALVAPDGQTIVQQFGTQYPPQVADVAYGLSADVATTALLSAGAAGRYLTTSDNALRETWFMPEFDDSTWLSATTGIGFDTGAAEEAQMVQAIKKLGPVGYWRFEETTGTVAANSGSGGPTLDGTYQGSPDLTAEGPRSGDPLFGFDDANSAINLDGRDDAITTDARLLNNLGQFTMMGMIRTATTTASRVGLWGQNDAIEFGFISGTTLQVWTAGGGSLDVNYPFGRNQWHHVAVVGTGNELQIYLDGQLVATGGTPTDDYGTSDFPFRIGGGGIFDATENWFRGRLDEVAVFDRALAGDEIASLFSGEAGSTQVSYTDQIATDVQATMAGKNASLLVRIPFEVSDPARFNQLTLLMKYDDGFVAYLNGTEVLRQNAPGEEEVPLALDASAALPHRDSSAVVFEALDVSDARDALRPGMNILAIQGLNLSADNPDFLLVPQLEAAVITVSPNQVGYLTTPTPGKPNATASQNLGPLVSDVSHMPLQPSQDDPLVIEARVTRTLEDVSTVELVYRVMYQDETTVAMADNGVAPDRIAGDGIYTATIPGAIAKPGEMIRWYVRAADRVDATGRLPRFEFRTGRNQDAEYFGTMVADPTIVSQIPVLHWFVQEPRRSEQRSGTRASLFFNGEFYDNLFVRQRGGSTASNPVNKTNFKFDFRGDRFRFDPRYDRVEEFNLNSTASDKAYVRQAMAFEAYTVMGAPSSISFPMHVRRNNEFYGVFVFIEEPDKNLLAREGLDPNGALYKMFNEFTSASGNRKKTRENEGIQDLQDFVQNVTRLRGDELRNYLYDNVDIPAVLNYLVATVLIHQNDNPHKNHFLYRDTEGSGEWLFLPWDHDLTWGSNWVGTSFSDVIYADVDDITFGPVPGHDLSVIHPSHPFVNTEKYREWNNHWNRLMDALLDDPTVREMYLRRLRTGMDQFLGPPGSQSSYFDRRFEELFQAMEPDVALDVARWATPRWRWGENQTFRQAIDVIHNEYLEVRRTHLYVTHGVDNLNPPPVTVLIPEFASGRYHIPANDSLGTSWTAVEFDDSSWVSGQSGFGFETTPRNYTDLIKTPVRPADSVADGTSIFIRMPFQLDEPSTVQKMTLRVKYDDGFIAYLNGREVARANVRDQQATYNSRAQARQNSQAVSFQNFVFAPEPGLLRAGTNVLAIHSLNSSATNNDQLLVPEFVAGEVLTVDVAGIPHGQQGNPLIRFDSTRYDATPVSGNQDEEFVKLDNPNNVAVDISGWRLAGGIEHVFRPGTVIASGSALYVSPDVRAFRARATGPSGGQGLFVQGSYRGHLSNRGDTVQLIAADGTLIDTLVIPASPSDVQKYLRITEVNFDPPSVDDATEFIELVNISSDGNAVTLDLTGVTLSQGPSEPFRIPQGTRLAPGEYLVLVNDVAAFRAAYPSVDPVRIAGPYAGHLDNAGERIKLDDALGNTIVDFNYGDGDPWPERADGQGATLELIDPANTPVEELGKYYRWRASTRFGGSPAGPDDPSIGVVVNEVLASTDPLSGLVDSIELLNTTDQPIDISGWWVSDSINVWQKYQIPAGTMLGAGQYLVLEEGQFNPTPRNPQPQHFALNGTQGDDVWIVISDGAGRIAQFVDDVHFGGTPDGRSLGRVPNSTGRLVPLIDRSLGQINGDAQIANVIISEVHYNPGYPSPAALQASANAEADDLEFFELYNASAAPVELTGWRVRGGVEMEFDPGATLQPGQTLVVLPFNPQRPENIDRTAAFRAHYQLDDSVQLAGGYQGRLSDSFDRLQLQRPGTAVGQDDIPHWYEDEIVYDDRAPWPTQADGKGVSLERRGPASLGSQAASWLAAAPSPGTTSFTPTPRGDFSGDGSLDVQDVDLLLAQLAAGGADPQFDLTGDGRVTVLDRDELILNVLGSTYGDVNLDRVFDSADLLLAAQASEFEDDVPGNSTWAEGDWDGDGDFTTKDVILAFKTGGFRNA